jgi:aspartyl-tRNA(Asn)/glutamyl-tRNA(Gln) amidotransferase subunit B
MYQPTVGLEIHIELNTKTKMFCSCLNDSDEKKPNNNICQVCLAHPGTLPVINQEAVKKVIKAGLALNCQINQDSKFDRKNYFYPDLPKGYQISQNDMPLCQKGFLEINNQKIRINRIHLEEDTGRLIHPENQDYSLVDFNRAGVPLMELVTEPDIKSGKQARKFAEELQLIMNYLEISSADMEKGEMRIEVNISMSEKKDQLGTKVEIKNLNSFKVVEKAIEFEIDRQLKKLELKEKIIQETRGWHDKKAVTFSQREKEQAHDYRYFPEPDLPPMEFSNDFIQEIRNSIPELPQAKRERFKKEYQLSDQAIEVFIQDKHLSYYFEKTVSELEPNLSQEKLGRLIKIINNYLVTDLKGLLKGESVTNEKFLIDPENFAEFVTLIDDGKLSSKAAKAVLLEMFNTGKDPSNIIEEENLGQITDQAEVEKIIQETIKENFKAVEDYKKGKQNSFQFLIGQIMAKSRGKANPETVKELLKKLLN